jgi:hypothetical protein
MRDVLEQELYLRYSWLEARNVWTGVKLGYCFPMECGDGWYKHIYGLCREIEGYYKEKGADINSLLIYQIKEKFGGLRFYVGNVIEGTFEIIERYENESEEVCEECGEEGKIRVNYGWLKCLCASCRDKYGYKDL